MDPWLDYEAIYDDAYYRGRGADPHVDYVAALLHPSTTTQRYEWRGILRRVESLAPVNRRTPWLDYGCGAGGLVQYLASQGFSAVVGYEQGWSEARLREHGIAHVPSAGLEERRGSFEVVTAIEVLEHSVDPVGELRKMRAALKPGGLLFVTTGNAWPYRKKLASWQYVRPEVHISFFEPGTLARALRSAGFEPRYPGFGPGWTDLYRGKALRTLGVHTSSWAERVVAWPLLARGFEAKLRLAQQPIGVAVAPPEDDA